jgi:hypothetical protein
MEAALPFLFALLFQELVLAANIGFVKNQEAHSANGTTILPVDATFTLRESMKPMIFYIFCTGVYVPNQNPRVSPSGIRFSHFSHPFKTVSLTIFSRASSEINSRCCRSGQVNLRKAPDMVAHYPMIG